MPAAVKTTRKPSIIHAIRWSPKTWQAIEAARVRFNADKGHEMTASDFIRHVLQLYLLNERRAA